MKYSVLMTLLFLVESREVVRDSGERDKGGGQDSRVTLGVQTVRIA